MHEDDAMSANTYAMPNFNFKSKDPTVLGKGACVAVPMPTVSVVDGRNGKAQGDVLPNRLKPFLPFVSDGFVSLLKSCKIQLLLTPPYMLQSKNSS